MLLGDNLSMSHQYCMVKLLTLAHSYGMGMRHSWALSQLAM